MAEPATTEASRAADARVEQTAKPWAILEDALLALPSQLAGIDTADLTPPIEAAAGAKNPGREMADGSGEVAFVTLRGTLTPRGSIFSYIYGYSGGGLQGFRERFQNAVDDDNVKAIIVDIDSPGGLVDQTPETAAVIRNARGKKPIVAIANTMAASGAYWIGCQADELVATPSAQVGSIGVFTVHEDISARIEALGVKVTITRAGRFKAEANPYEPLSKAAEAARQDQVNELYDLFTNDVAKARNVAVQVVKAGYGEGRVVLARRALALNMVDRIETLEQLVQRLGGKAVDEPDAANPDEVEDDGDFDAKATTDATAAAEEPAEPAVEAEADAAAAEETDTDTDTPEPEAEASGDEPAPAEGTEGADTPPAAETEASATATRLYGEDRPEKPAWLL